MKFRKDCELYDEAMRSVVEFSSLDELKEHIAKIYPNWIPRELLDNIQIRPHVYDHRNGWDTHIVTVPHYGVVGYTDGPIQGTLP